MKSIVVHGIMLLCLSLTTRLSFAASDEFFEKSIRPLLVERCISCHSGPTAKAELRLDSREKMLLGGESGSIVIVGKPNASKIISAVKRQGELKMPPDQPLSDSQIKALEQWIAEGAKWPAKSTIAPKESVTVAGTNHWSFQPIISTKVPKAGHPIDAFIDAKLTDKKLVRSPEADRRTLIRRLSFDLIGLPPTPAEVELFLTDKSADAYEKLVDRLLASPHYGERSARHWMDVARYADNKGYVFFEQKEYPWAWTYRDYLINAFNADVPYDRFIQEQIAADRLQRTDDRTLAALGFLTIGSHFMGNVHDMIDDRIDTITRGIMGMTVACARCHDHKFDPIPQADYYSLYGIFRSSTEPTIPPLWGKPPETMEYQKFAAELADKEKKLLQFVHAKHHELVTQARARATDYLLAAHAACNQPPADDFMLIADKGDLNPAMIARWKAFLETTRKRKDTSWAFWHRYADVNETDFATVSLVVADNPLVSNAFKTPPKSMKEVAERYGKLLAQVDADFKANGSKLPLNDPHAEALRATLYGPTSPADAPLSLDWGFLSLFPDRATQGEYQKLIKEVEQHATKGPPRSMVLLDAERPYEPRIFQRGQPNRLGAEVPRQFLSILQKKPQPYQQGSGRLELAQAITSPTNPLTPRVIVNKIWMHHFGRGIVNTPGDFGTRGDVPSHPELLDWLASDFITKGWSMKKLHRFMVTSATYRQQSNENPTASKIDPENVFLWKQNRRRLEFEALHDAMLSVSGSLSTTIGGPSFALFTGNTRRAVYGSIDRLEFPSLLATFDVPSPAAASTERTTTTVPPQALYLMNGPFSRDAARRLINKPSISQPKQLSQKIEQLFLAVYSRQPSARELTRLTEYVQKGSEADRLLDLAHGLLMTNEFTFVD